MFFKQSTILYVFSVILLISLIYVFENKVNEINLKISSSSEKIKKYKEDILVFESEWSYQNSPARLTNLMVSIREREIMTEAKLPQFSNLTNLPEKDFSDIKTAGKSNIPNFILQEAMQN